MTRNRLSFIDLFAGCGGLSLGLELAGFDPLFVNELSPEALETYLLNRDKSFPKLRAKYHCRDIKTLTSRKARGLAELVANVKKDYGVDARKGEVDLVAGGPPCQGFSGIGHRRSYWVEKKALPANHLFRDMAKVIERVNPKAFLFENVQGLLNSRWGSDGERGEVWDEVRRTFERIPGYVVRSALIHAKDYGVPQNRPRVLLVGIRKDLAPPSVFGAPAEGFLPNPTRNAPAIADLLSDLVDKDYASGQRSTSRYPTAATTAIQRWLRTHPGDGAIALKGSPVSEHDYSKHRPETVKKFRYMLAHDGRIPEAMRTAKFAQRVLPEIWGESGPSITVTSLPDDYIHYEQPRTLTVREWARLQTFPDWYQFSGKRTTGGIRRAGNPQDGIFDREVPKYTQIGNAVPVLVAKAVGCHLARLIRPTQ